MTIKATQPPGRGSRTHAWLSRGQGRYGLLLLVLIGTYLLAAFSGATVATEIQVVLFALVVLIALRTSPLPGPGQWSSAPLRSSVPSSRT